MGLLGKLLGRKSPLEKKIEGLVYDIAGLPVGKPLANAQKKLARLYQDAGMVVAASNVYVDLAKTCGYLGDKDLSQEYDRIAESIKPQPIAILTTSLLLIIASILVFSINITGITGNVIGGLDKTTMSWIGIILFVLGIGILYWLRRKSKCCDMGKNKKAKKTKKNKKVEVEKVKVKKLGKKESKKTKKKK